MIYSRSLGVLQAERREDNAWRDTPTTLRGKCELRRVELYDVSLVSDYALEKVLYQKVIEVILGLIHEE